MTITSISFAVTMTAAAIRLRPHHPSIQTPSSTKFEAMMAEEFESLRVLAETHARWNAQEQERLAAALQSPLGQRYLWGDAA